MELNITLLLALILVPVFFAAGALLIGGRARWLVVGVSAFVIAALGIYVGYLVANKALPAEVAQSDLAATAGLALEGLLILVVGVIAIRIRSVLIGLLAAGQLALAVTEHFISGHSLASAGPAFVIDTLSTILVLVVTVIGSAIVFYAIGYMKNHSHHAPATAAGNGRFFFFLIGFLGVMNGLVLANDLKWLSIFWEATTLCSFFLIGHDRTDDAKRNAKRALLINSFGGLAMLGATVLAVSGGAASSLSGIMAHKSAMIVPMALLCLAAFTKSAQMPFQSWLLGAMVAPTPVSALLHSATMVKAGSYLVLRLAPGFMDTKLSMIVALAGAFTFMFTSALAITQSNGKKVLAYSTIANLGLIVTCAGINTPVAYAAGLMILCFHAASKGLLFLCMGTIEQKIGSRDIEDMGGIMWRLPFTTVVTMVGMVSMLVPPFGMLLSKWISIEAAINSPLVLMLIIGGSALTVMFWAKWIGRIQTVSYHEKYTMEKLPSSMFTTMLLLAIVVVAAGAMSMPIYQHILVPQSIWAYAGLVAWDSPAMVQLQSIGQMAVWPLFILPGAAVICAYFSFRCFKGKDIRLPFLCGENLEGGIPAYTFRSIGDRGETAWASSYYLRDVCTEGRVTLWSNLLAAMILLAMFGMIL